MKKKTKRTFPPEPLAREEVCRLDGRLRIGILNRPEKPSP